MCCCRGSQKMFTERACLVSSADVMARKLSAFLRLKCPCTPLKCSFIPLKCPSPKPLSIAMSISESNNLSHSLHEVKLQMCLYNPGNVYILSKVGNVLKFRPTLMDIRVSITFFTFTLLCDKNITHLIKSHQS